MVIVISKKEKEIKKITIITALLMALMLLVSCPGTETGNPATQEESTGSGSGTPTTPAGNGNGSGSVYAGLTALNESIPTIEALSEGETFTEADMNASLSGLEGTWHAVYSEKHFSPAPKYAKKVTEEKVIAASTESSDTYTCTDKYIYDFTAAVTELGASSWNAIKEAEDLPDTYTIVDYVATQTPGNNGESCSTTGDVFGNNLYPTAVTVSLNAATYSDVTKIKVYNSIAQNTKIYVKQDD